MLKIKEIHQTPNVNEEVLHLARRANQLAKTMRWDDSSLLRVGAVGSLQAVTGMLLRLLECPEKTVNDVAVELIQEEHEEEPEDFGIEPELFHPWEDAPSSDADRAGMPERGEL